MPRRYKTFANAASIYIAEMGKKAFFDQYFWESNTVCCEESGKRSENKQKEDLS